MLTAEVRKCGPNESELSSMLLRRRVLREDEVTRYVFGNPKVLEDFVYVLYCRRCSKIHTSRLDVQQARDRLHVSEVCRVRKSCVFHKLRSPLSRSVEDAEDLLYYKTFPSAPSFFLFIHTHTLSNLKKSNPGQVHVGALPSAH
jgi:hypothetical protein